MVGSKSKARAGGGLVKESPEHERFTEQASNVLFFAQYYSSPRRPLPIEPEHMLLALLLVDPRLFQLVSPNGSADVATISSELKAFNPTRRKPWLAAEPPPLSTSSQAVVASAAEECRRLGHSCIGTEHLLLALIKSREPGSSGGQGPSRASVILHQVGLTVERVTGEVQAGSITPQEGQDGSHRLIGERRSSDNPKMRK